MTSITHLRTAMSAPVSVKAHPERTPEQYALSVAAQFGGKLPGWHELARIENRAMWKAAPGPNWNSHAIANSVNAKRISCGRFPKVDMAARYALILSALPGTAQEVAERAKVSIHIATDTLRMMRADGLVTNYRAGQSAIWQRAERMEAAE